MNRRFTDETEAGKSSFRASTSRESTLQNRRAVKAAIDESLSSVRFNAQDMRTVMRAAHGEKKRAPSKRNRRTFRPDLLFTFSLVLLVAMPLSLYALRSRENITTIVTGPGETAQPVVTAQPDADIITPKATATVAPSATTAPEADGTINESDAIRIARECFNAHCDMTIFSFDEYEVSVKRSESAQYTVTMDSIYKNGCTFTVVISAETGAVLQYSTPRLATVPSHIDSDSPAVRAWFDKYGETLITWPQDVQAEFSRRYQGGTLRTAKDGEISYETVLAAVQSAVEEEAPDLFTAFYPVLYSERASGTGRAYYLVYCYAQPITGSSPDDQPMIVSFDAETGDILGVENNPLDGE